SEQVAFNRAGWHYFHIAPAEPLTLLADPTPARHFRVLVRLDGQALGFAAFSDLMAVAKGLRESGVGGRCVVHHLMGHVPELIQELAEACDASPIIAWVHDFFTCCPSYALMRNDVAFCGAPGVASEACGICCYGAERAYHQIRMRAFFEIGRPVVLAPSR